MFRRQRTGQRSTKERNQCVPCRPCDPDASGAAFKWNLFTEPGEDRLTLSCLMDIDKNGQVIDHKIAETIIRVDRRMSYTQVRCILEDGDTETSLEYADFVPMFS